jgi:hypothetical protein
MRLKNCKVLIIGVFPVVLYLLTMANAYTMPTPPEVIAVTRIHFPYKTLILKDKHP